MLPFFQASLAGCLAGVSLGGNWMNFFSLPLSLALLWSISQFTLAGFCWGFFAVLISHRWMLALHPLSWIGIPIPLSLPLTVFLWLLCGCLGGILVSLWLFILKPSSVIFSENNSIKRKIFYVIFCSSLWGLAEVLLAQSPFFWIGLGSGFLPGNRFLAGLGRWFGAGGLAALQLIIGWWIFQVLFLLRKRLKWRKLFFYGLVSLITLHLIGWQILSEDIDSDTFNVSIWQTNIPIRKKFTKEYREQIPKLLQDSIRQSEINNSDLLIAPEGTLLLDYKLMTPSTIDLLLGGFRRGDSGNLRNSLLLYQAGLKNFSNFIDKNRLVPLGEWVPFSKSFNITGLSSLGGLERGLPSRLFVWDGPNLGIAICYELTNGRALAKAAFEGAELILASANLDPYPESLQRQFIILAQLRSIETAKDLITVANTGPSSHITSKAEIDFIMSPFSQGTDLIKSGLNNYKTLYVKWGEWPVFLCIIIGIIGRYKFK